MGKIDEDFTGTTAPNYDTPIKKPENICHYVGCSEPVFATELLTGMNGKLCQRHFKKVFGKVIANAKIIDENGKEL